MQSHRDVPGLADDALWLRRLACRVAGSQRADDLAQEALLAALRADPPRGNRRQWLAGILRNLHRMDRRSNARRTRREQAAGRNAPSSSPLRALERNELRLRLIAAVQALPVPYRSAIVQRFFEGRSAARIARDAGVPSSTIRNRTRRGLRLVRARLEREYGGDPRFLLLGPLLQLPRPGRRWRVRTAVAAALLCLLGFAMPASAEAETPPDPGPPRYSPPPPVEEAEPEPVQIAPVLKSGRTRHDCLV